jgi:lipopolysaccharide export system protein LptA
MIIKRMLCALLALGTGPAFAQALKNHDTNAPVDFAADRIEVQDRANRAVLSGNVRVTQGDLALSTMRMTVSYTGAIQAGKPTVSRLDASGGVTVKSADQTARGSFAIYDLDRKLITMIGNVTLEQGVNIVRGNRLVIDLRTGRAIVDGNGAGTGATTGTGGRVTGSFSVPQRN